jgi:hypothetical protein
MNTVETSVSDRASGSDKALVKASCSWFSITPTTGALLPRWVSMNRFHYALWLSDVLQSASANYHQIKWPNYPAAILGRLLFGSLAVTATLPLVNLEWWMWLAGISCSVIGQCELLHETVLRWDAGAALGDCSVGRFSD